MADVLYLVLTVAFFVGMALLGVALDRRQPR